MIVTVEFPIRNDVYVDAGWPIMQATRTYRLRMDGDKANAVSVRIAGVPVEEAPRFTANKSGRVAGHLRTGTERFALEAEHDIRAWQAILVPFALIDVDFESPTFHFEAESEAERSLVRIPTYSKSITSTRMRGTEDFSVYGRAFLAIDRGRPQIEVMAFYRDALIALRAGRCIDAFNGFYLFLETQFCRGRSGLEQATNALMAQLEAVRAIADALELIDMVSQFQNLSKVGQDAFKADPRPFIREIVQLRGKLRHHSLGSPSRWDPDRQHEYDVEARFLSVVAQAIAYPRTVGVLWEEPYTSGFTRIAEELRMTIDVRVELALRVSEHIDRHSLRMTIPTRTVNAALAKKTLNLALNEIEKRSPGAELFALRAVVEKTGEELFRYDVGSTIAR